MSAPEQAAQRLPSPPVSLNGDYEVGLSQLIQHNDFTPQRLSPYNHDGGYLQSGQSTTYGSPASNHWLADRHETEANQDSWTKGDNADVGIRQEWYDDPMLSQNQSTAYNSMTPREHPQYARYEFGSGSPPTPTASDLSSGERQGTRSSRPTGLSRLPRPQRRSTLDRSPAHNPVKSRKATKNSKNDKPKVPKLDAPLSELTKGYNNIPLKNMDEWVNRSAEVRRNEVEKRNGYVTRPMNSFMLYRSAFAERTKIWCLQNNHQIVSSVSGESWPMEPPDVREQYNEYARIERDNHHKAHPGYKFSPSKAQNSARKRKGISEEPEDENPSDQDPDFEWRPSSTRNSRIKPGKRQGQAAGYQKNSTPRSDAGFGLQQSDLGYNPSSYQASNPGKPLPARMGEHDTYGQYYQTTVHQNENGHNIEDVYLRRMNIPYGHYRSAPPVISLPGARHYELIGNGAFDNTPEPVNENQVDPTLLAYDNSFADHANGFINEQQFKDYNDDLLFGPENFSRSQPSEEASHTNFNSWQLGLVASAEAEDDFAKWMAQNNDR